MPQMGLTGLKSPELSCLFLENLEESHFPPLLVSVPTLMACIQLLRQVPHLPDPRFFCLPFTLKPLVIILGPFEKLILRLDDQQI